MKRDFKNRKTVLKEKSGIKKRSKYKKPTGKGNRQTRKRKAAEKFSDRIIFY